MCACNYWDVSLLCTCHQNSCLIIYPHPLSPSLPPSPVRDFQAYFFDDNDSDDQSASDLSPLIRRPSAQATPTPYTHIITSYLSIAELIVLVSEMSQI